MKHLFSILFLMSICILCNCQTNIYHPFLHDGGKWSILNRTWESGIEGDTSYFFYKLCSDGDTIIGGEKYFKVKNVFDDTCSNSFNALLREDTTARKVYLNRFNIQFDGDSLLYDFSALEGQSLSHCLTFSHFDSSKISSIDSIYLDGNFRKRFNILFYIDGNSDSTYWIEGIGAVFGPSPFTADPGDFGYGIYTPQAEISQVICYKENNEVIYQQPFAVFNCNTGPLQINNSLKNSIKIYPNPSTSGRPLSIVNTDKMHYDCEIVSITGTVVYRFAITGTYQVNTKNIPGGYYYIIFKNQNNYFANALIIL